ncbi:hypothetical protein Acr_17g0007590 [Actinidia rufa]|uniref:Uncharacterized protein n=1 Tax=Actinidia rufa TaxID=165716 RepID=A0A7J0G334_9ERIC|nr:hypothetical protein Acr_17g0007590 [Actinidia rufa]
MVFRNAGGDLPIDGAPASSGNTGMSKRVNFKKLVEEVEKSKDEGSVARRARLLTTPRERLGDVACSRTTSLPKPEEGTSTNLSTILGPGAFILGIPSVVEKILQGVIPPADKEKVEKFTLDQTATKLFHVIGQSKEVGEKAPLQQGRAASSLKSEVSRFQKLVGELEQQLVEAQSREQQTIDELAKVKDNEMQLLTSWRSRGFGGGIEGNRGPIQNLCCRGVQILVGLCGSN